MSDKQPSEILYGAETEKALNNFTISQLVMPPSFIRALASIKRAWAYGNHETGDLSKEKSDAIQSAAELIMDGRYHDQFPVDVFQTGSGTSTNMNMNEVLASLCKKSSQVEVHANDDVNMSQSSNDVIPSAIHIAAVLDIKQNLLVGLLKLEKALANKAAQHTQSIKTGRTHLMDALPMSFEQEINAWRAQINRSISRLDRGLENASFLALGGTAIGSSFNATDEGIAHTYQYLNQINQANFKPNSDLFSAISGQDISVELSGYLKALAVSLMKINNDIRWMNSGPLNGLNEMTSPEFQKGSSIMPGKVNPVLSEAICMASAQVMGNDTVISVGAQEGNFQLNTYLPVIGYNLLQSIDLMSRCAETMAQKLVPNFNIKHTATAENANRNPILATALNQQVGYDKATEIAREAYQSGKPIFEVAKQMTDLDEDQLNQLLDPKNFI